DRRYEEIVDFSGIREFINMPVQSYSTGMVVRLGFSVAAHLEPDVLLVDEVLAVGDLAFRNKCQLRIQELKKRGVAIIFVSHNLHAISHVCSRAIAIEKGRIVYDGKVEKAIDLYRESLINLYQEPEELRAGTGEIKIQRIELLDAADQVRKEINMGDFLKVRIHYVTTQPVDNPIFNITFSILYGEQVTGLRTDVDGFEVGRVDGEGFVDITIPHFNLLPNVFTIDATIFHPDGFTFYDRINKIATLKVRGGLLINGTAFLPHDWATSQEVKTATESQTPFR
ncbi:MAG: ABC transporter ATP-binding protein, partial [Anaerolineae bacterium]|nr:ABC transporter ATP-binding protein [Anaerolineae bacterium]